MEKKKNGKIDQTLRKIADDTWKANIPNSSNTDVDHTLKSDLPGDPDCAICHGMGYLRRDLPIGHPDFGKVILCTCRDEQVSQRVRQRLFELSHLDELRDLTFDNFNPRGRLGLFPLQADSLEIAYNQSRRYSENLEGWLLLQGGYGCGKTHLAAAIANFAVGLGIPTLFITVPDLLDTLRFAYSDPQESFEDRFEQIRQAALLVLDDFGSQNATSWAQEKLFQIINYRYINRLPLVITTNLTDRNIDERIQSRFSDSDWVTNVKILAPDYRNPAGAHGHDPLSSLELFPGKTFENFDLRKDEGINREDLRSLEKAYHAAREYADAPNGWLALLGSYSTGKTHLAAAIGNRVGVHSLPPLMIAVPDLLDHLRATFSPNSLVTLDRRFEEIRSASLLILDDLGTQSSTPWVKEKLYQLFNFRYNAELPTVITSSATLEELDPRLRSRMLDRRICEIYAITVPPFQGYTRQQKRSTSRRKQT